MHRLFALGAALLGFHAHAAAVPASCPAGTPVQTITVINQAHVRPFALARVENAVVAQSMQLRAAWATPCVQFGPGGWPLYLQIGGAIHGVHYYNGQPYAFVWTAGATVEGWSRVFSHETIEMLADPTTGRVVYHNDVGSLVEIADPVENAGYPLDGVLVSDFVLPAWYADGTTGNPTCSASACVFPGPFLASPDSQGPYDMVGAVAAPWTDQGSV